MKKILLLIFCIVLLVGTVSAADWDNVKRYDKETKTITIRNNLGLPFIGNKLAEYTLTDNSDECLINCYAEGTVIIYSKDKLFRELSFYNNKKKLTTLKSYSISLATNESYQHEVKDYEEACLKKINGTVCTQEQIGTHYETRYKLIWKEYTGKTLIPNKYWWRIDGEKNTGGAIEWIGSSFGKDFEEWAWWNSSWKRQKPVNIFLDAGSTPANFQVKINVTYDSEMKTDFSDVRFVDTDNSTELNYWLEDKIDSSWAYFWVNVNDVITTSNQTVLYMYYNNLGASDTSNGALTFEFFDDFDTANTTKWLEVTGSLVVSNGKAVIDNDVIRGDIALGPNLVAWEMNASYDGSCCSGFSLGFNRSVTDYGVVWRQNEGTPKSQMSVFNVAHESVNPFWATSPTSPTIYSIIQFSSAYIAAYEDLVLKGSSNTIVPDGAMYPGFRSYSNSELLVDWVRVRKFYDAAFTISFGEEEVSFIFPTITLIAPDDNSNFTASNVTFNITVTDNIEVSEVNLFIDGVLNNTNTSLVNGTYIYNLDFIDGNYNWSIGATDDEDNIANSSVRDFIIDTINPSLNIIYPTDTTYWTNYTTIPNITVQLNWTTTDANLDTCWFYNFTSGANETLTCGDNATLILNYSSYTFQVYANDTLGHNGSDNVTATWMYKFLENSYVYNNESYELDSETFTINLSSDGSEIILGYLVYNGTAYLATKTGDDYSMEFNRTITLNQTGNVSFYWGFNYGGEIINSSIFYQNVNETLMGICSGSLTTQTLNFTAYNEEDFSRLTPYNFFGTFEYWLGDRSVTKSFSISNASINNVTICININNTFYSDAKIQYEKEAFVKRSYYLINETLTNSSQNKDLFLLNTSTSTSFIIEVKDDVQIPIPEVYIYIQRYYSGTDQYKTVEMALTDVSGSTLGHFEAETEDYRVVFEKEGIIIFQSGTQKIFCRETPCTLTFQTEAGVGITWDEFGVVDLFDWTLDYDEGTKIWTLIYTDTSGSIGYGRLYVYYEEPVTGKITICNTTSSQLADTLTCDVTGYNGTIYAAAYVSRSPEILVYLKSILISALKTIFGLEGLVLSMFVLLLLGLAGLWNPAVGIILIVVGMVALNLIGLASFGAVTIWGVIFIALLLLWALKT